MSLSGEVVIYLPAIAAGADLDRVAEVYGLRRRHRWFFWLETDQQLRARVLEVMEVLARQRRIVEAYRASSIRK